MHGWLFKDINVVKLKYFAILTIDPPRLNNPINLFSIHPKIILYHAVSLNIYEHW